MLEWQEYEAAEQYLRLSIAICGKHREIAAYQRRQTELLGHLLRVYFTAGEYGKCREVIAMLNDGYCKDAGSNIEQLVPTEIREAIFN